MPYGTNGSVPNGTSGLAPPMTWSCGKTAIGPPGGNATLPEAADVPPGASAAAMTGVAAESAAGTAKAVRQKRAKRAKREVVQSHGVPCHRLYVGSVPVHR